MSKQPVAIAMADWLESDSFEPPKPSDMSIAAELRRLHAVNVELLAALKGMVAIVDDSRGVAGYHLNGDTAEWDEFDEVDAALAVIAKATGEQA